MSSSAFRASRAAVSSRHNAERGADESCRNLGIILTTWQGKLHEVIYQTPAKDEDAAASRNAAQFVHYGDGHPFNEVLDNGFGKTYRRADMQRYALWSYAMYFTTVGMMDFHVVKWG